MKKYYTVQRISNKKYQVIFVVNNDKFFVISCHCLKNAELIADILSADFDNLNYKESPFYC